MENTVFVMKTDFASHRLFRWFFIKSNLRENRKFSRERALGDFKTALFVLNYWLNILQNNAVLSG